MSPMNENDLRDQLRHDPHSPLDPHALASGIVNRGKAIRRRRQIVAVVGGVAAAALAIVVGVNALTIGSPAALTPGGTASVTASAGTTASGEPSGEPTTEPTRTGATDRPTGATHTDSTAPTDPVGPVQMPALLHEGLTIQQIDEIDGGRSAIEEFRPVPSLAEDLKPCDFTGDPRPMDTPVLESKAIGQAFGSGGREEGLLVFADADLAQAAMAEIRDRFTCGVAEQDDYVGMETHPLDGRWGDGFRVNYATHGYGFSSWYYIARVGRSVMWTSISGDGGFGVKDPVAEMDELLRAPLEDLYPQLCRYTEAGC